MSRFGLFVDASVIALFGWNWNFDGGILGGMDVPIDGPRLPRQAEMGAAITSDKVTI